MASRPTREKVLSHCAWPEADAGAAHRAARHRTAAKQRLMARLWRMVPPWLVTVGADRLWKRWSACESFFANRYFRNRQKRCGAVLKQRRPGLREQTGAGYTVHRAVPKLCRPDS